MYTEVVRTKGCCGALTSSATVGVGGGEGHAREVENVTKGKGCGDPRGPHRVLDGSKIQVEEVWLCFPWAPAFSFIERGHKYLPYPSKMICTEPPTPTWTLKSRAQFSPFLEFFHHTSCQPPRPWICEAIYDALSISVLAEECGGGQMEPVVLSISHLAAISKEILIVSSDLL